MLSPLPVSRQHLAAPARALDCAGSSKDAGGSIGGTAAASCSTINDTQAEAAC